MDRYAHGLSLAAVGLLMLGACGSSGGAAATSAASGHPPSEGAELPPDAVAVVDGRPITNLDVSIRLENEGHGVADTPQNRKKVLETVIRQELASQRAIALGLDDDPGYRAGLRALEAQVDAYRRKELAELLYAHEVREKSKPSEEEARAFFAENGSRIGTRVRVLQILRRTREAIEAAQAELAAGKSFDEVAAGAGPPPPDGKKPWDLGFLAWQQVPEPWRAVVYDLAPGATSDILVGPNKRFWIIQLVAKEQGEAPSFESVKEGILTDLGARKADAARAALDKELREAAAIECLAAPSVPRRED